MSAPELVFHVPAQAPIRVDVPTPHTFLESATGAS
jgi:hypothetical protein